ncbi:LysM domain-containing protein [uncultured Aquitalea sp.]|uniref:LysM peptidoglycan-binding domain-containing protein n=1 Tax=uncultured Aquitalea sp. TaxID=540272 RepID=UPI0025DC4347|nr:LysM domain-containing protein [uncultured Aquitalea sp.]
MALGLALPAFSDTLTLRADAPTRYTVVKGDTLWGISGRYLKSPWKWPQLWRMNKSEIRNPHWIYPGDVLVLTYVNGEPRLTLEKGAQGDIKLSPQMRMDDIDQAVNSIPAKAIEPFLKRPLVTDQAQFQSAPVLIAGPEQRLAFGTGDKVYANGVTEPGSWQAFRPGKPLIDPDTKENLGYEVVYGGDLVVDKISPDVQTLRVTGIAEEILKGDRLVKAPKDQFVRYVPHAPDNGVQGKIIAIYNGVDGAAQYSTVIINRGSREGVESGHVFGVFKKGKPMEITAADGQKKVVLLPAEPGGKVFIYRVFEKVSYGLVMESATELNKGDVIAAPEAE